MRKTLFLTAILGALVTSQALAGWNNDETIYTFTGSGDIDWASVVGTSTLTKIIVASGVEVSTGDNTGLTMNSKLSSVEVNGTLNVQGELKFDSANTTLSGTGMVNAASVKYYSQSNSQFTQSVANFNVTGNASVDAFYADPIFSGNNVSLANGLSIANWNGSSTVTLNGVTLSLGNTIRRSGGALAPELSISGANTIDVSGLEYSLVAGSYTLPEDNGFVTAKCSYTVLSGIGTVTYADGATVTYKRGTTTLGDTDNLSTTTGILTTDAVKTGYYALKDGTTTMTSAELKTAADGENVTLDYVLVSAGNTVHLTTTDLALKNVSGAGNVTISTVEQTLSDAGSAATGKLLISGQTLNVNTSNGAATLGSIGSFTSVELAGGTINYNNASSETTADQFQNVSVENNSTGTINMVDCGGGDNGQVVTMSGTTTIGDKGTLNLMNKWQGRLTISNLQGSGAVMIYGSSTTSTASDQSMYYNIGIVGANFTGSITANNTKANITLNIGENGSINASQVTKTNAASLTADGSGTIYVTGTTFSLGGISLASTWAGSVIGTGTNVSGFDLSQLTANGTDAIRKVDGLSGYIAKAAETIGNLEIGSKGLTLTNGYSDNYYDITNLSGTGTITRAQGGGSGLNVHFSVSGNSTANFKGDCNTGKMTVKFNGESNQAISSNFTKGTDSGDQAVAIEVEGAGTKTFSGSVTASSLSVAAASTVAFTQALTTGTLSSSGTLTLTESNLETSSLTLGGGTITLGTTGSHDADLTTTTLTVNSTTAINADLVIKSNGSMTFANAQSLTMGCDVTIGTDVTLTLSDAAKESAAAGNLVTLMTGVDNLTVTGADGKTYNLEKSDTAQEVQGVFANYQDADHKVVYQGGALMVTPEPATATLSLLALAGLCTRRRRK